MVKISPQMCHLHLHRSPFKAFPLPQILQSLAEPGEKAGCERCRYANVLLLAISASQLPQLPSGHPPHRTAGLNAAGQAWPCQQCTMRCSAGCGLWADMRNKEATRSMLITPSLMYTWAICRARLCLLCFQFKALGRCQSDQMKKWSLPLFPQHVSHNLVVATVPPSFSPPVILGITSVSVMVIPAGPIYQIMAHLK